MTDKRFKLAYCDYDWWAITDTKGETKENDYSDAISGEIVVNLLNELHEENMKLALQVRMLEQVKPIKKIPKSIDVVWNDNNKISKLENENKQLKKELKDYYNAFDCNQCKYHNYDWFDDGDEFEVCDKGNNEAQMDNHSCKDWEEL